MAAPLDPGKLNRKVSIQEQVTTRDEFNQSVNEWTSLFSAWAYVRPASGKEVFAVSGFVSEMSHIVTIRYTPALITTDMRVLYGTRVLRIQGVSDPDEAHVQLNLMCLEDSEANQ